MGRTADGGAKVLTELQVVLDENKMMVDKNHVWERERVTGEKDEKGTVDGDVGLNRASLRLISRVREVWRFGCDISVLEPLN